MFICILNKINRPTRKIQRPKQTDFLKYSNASKNPILNIVGQRRGDYPNSKQGVYSVVVIKIITEVFL